MMHHHNQLFQQQKEKLVKAIGHLEYSYQKVQRLKVKLNELDEEGLETWESFAA